MRRVLLVLVVLVVAVGLAAGAWQVAYARGEAAGRAAVMTARADFVQGRTGAGLGGGGGAVAAAGDGAAAAGKPGDRAGGGAANATPGAGFGGGPGGRAGGGAGQFGGGQAPVVGTIGNVEGSTMTVTTDTGSVTVTLDDQTQVRRQVAASVSDLKAGDRVLVTGARTADSGVTAAMIQIQGQ